VFGSFISFVMVINFVQVACEKIFQVIEGIEKIPYAGVFVVCSQPALSISRWLDRIQNCRVKSEVVAEAEVLRLAVGVVGNDFFNLLKCLVVVDN
jgi:hypothetical protein